MHSIRVFKLKSIKQVSMLIPLQTTRVARNPYHQVAITHARHVCCQHLFGLPLRINAPFECIERKDYSVGARMLWPSTSPALPSLSLLLLRMLKQMTWKRSTFTEEVLFNKASILPLWSTRPFRRRQTIPHHRIQGRFTLSQVETKNLDYIIKYTLRADVSRYRPEVYKSEKSKILKKIHKVALGKLLT